MAARRRKDGSHTLEHAGNLTTLRDYSGILYNEDNQIQDDWWAFDYDGNGNAVVHYYGYLGFDVENRLSEDSGGQLYGYTGSGLRAWRQTGVNVRLAYTTSRLSPAAVGGQLVGVELEPGAASRVAVAVDHVVGGRVVPDWPGLRIVAVVPGARLQHKRR